MSLESRLAALEARQPPSEPPTPCPQQAAWLESLPDPARAAAALLLPDAHPARDQGAAAWRDWLAAVAQAEQTEDAQRAAGYYAWQYNPGTALTWGEPYRPQATIYATIRTCRRTGWPAYFGCAAAPCACWQWVQAQPDPPAPGEGDS